MKNHNKDIAIDDGDVETFKNLTNSLDAHDADAFNNGPFLFETMNKINRIVDKNEHGVVEQGVYIGAPVMAGGTRVRKQTMIGTDSATYLPSTNATESLVDVISMGGAKFHDKDIKKARDSMAKYLSGVKKTKPMAKNLKILQDSGD